MSPSDPNAVVLYEWVVGIATALFGGVVCLLLATLLHHARISLRLWSRARRRERLLPLLCRALADPDHTDALVAAVRRRDRPALRSALLQVALDVRGDDARSVAHLARVLGLADAEQRGLRSPRASRRARAAKNLGLLRVRSALPALLQRLTSDRSRAVRLAAVWALGEIGGPGAQLGLLSVLEDPDPGLVRRAQEVLLASARDAAPKLVGFVRLRTAPAARCAAVEVLGRLRDPAASELLLDLMESADGELLVKAAKAAASIGDPRFETSFLRLLRSPGWPVRCQAARGLGALGARGSVPALRERLGDTAWWVRFNAAEALRELGAEGHRALAAAVHGDAPRAREVARYVLERAAPSRMAA